MTEENMECVAFEICKQLDNTNWFCQKVNPQFATNLTERECLQRVSYQLEEMKHCLHSLVLLLAKK